MLGVEKANKDNTIKKKEIALAIYGLKQTVYSKFKVTINIDHNAKINDIRWDCLFPNNLDDCLGWITAAPLETHI